MTGKDFLLYELSAEYTNRQTNKFEAIRYSFADHVQIVGDRTEGQTVDKKEALPGALEIPHQTPDGGAFVGFSLLNVGQRVSSSNVADTIAIKVKAFDGSILWYNEFGPVDPGLQTLDIEVPLQRPVTLIAPGTPAVPDAPDAPTKLRGQVLTLGKKCSLQGLQVVIQAKGRGDTLWKIVAAAATDSAGNFSVPYPFGVFTEAQALVSATPDSPAAVRVTEVRNGNETIADDFLYLLLKDFECPQVDPKDDCDCNAKKCPARLPDHADLIGSDEYSQDIGGSCVNLSTPNRTLSEFNYQAIVRTSDPDVANYTLVKGEGFAEAGIDPVHSLEIARALSALDDGLKNQVLQSGLPQAALSAASTQMATLRTLIEQATNANAAPAITKADVTAAIQNLDLLTSGLISSLAAYNVNTFASGSAGSVQTQGGSALETTIRDEIGRVVLNLESPPTNPGETPPNLDWDRYEGAIRQAVVNAGGVPLASTFFFQFAQWRTGVPQRTTILASGVPTSYFSASDLFKEVARDAAKAGASVAGGVAANAPSGVLVSTLPVDTVNAASYLLALANDLKAQLNAAQMVRLETVYSLDGGARKRQRKPADLDNLVAWQDDDQPVALNQPVPVATLCQAVTVATGHILHYKSEFKADGYSLGDLIYSLPLAPGQKKEIVVLDASHRLVGTESQTVSQGERLTAGIVDERTILSSLGGRIGESVRGASSANTSGISAGFGTGGQGYGGTGAYGGSGSAVIGVAGGVANSNSSAWQDSSRDVSQFFGETLRQSIMQNANDYRQLNASVVTTVEEGQQYGVTTEVVANHNHCHALTIMYFEVLRHYAIFQSLSSVEECVFVPLLMTNFAAPNIYKWRDVLARSLLPMASDSYLQSLAGPTASSPQQHPLLRAFDANERILTNYANVDYPAGSYDEETIQFIRGNMRIRVELPRPRTRYDRIMSLPVTKQIDAQALSDAVQKFSQDAASYSAKAAFTAGLWTAFEKPPIPPDPMQYQVLATEAISDAFMSMDANFQSVPPAQCMRITNFKPQPVSFGAGQFTLNPIVGSTALDFFAENLDDRNQWQAYADILGYRDVESMLNAYFKGNLISEWDTIFYTDIAPLVFEKIVSRITLSEFSTDFSSETKYKGGESAMRLNLTGTTSKKRKDLPLELTLAINDQNFKKLKEYITFNVEDVTISYFTAHYRGVLCAGNVNDDLFDDTALYIPESADEKRNLRKEDAYLVYKLIEHLNSNLEYYNKALWNNLDPDRRYMLLDGFDIQIFDDYGVPVGRRSLASVIKNELITIAGNSLVFPVAPGYRVSQSYLSEQTANGTAQVSLLDHYQPITPIEPYRISVPTRGVFAEAVQGACNSCEEIETDRLQDWNQFPNTDEPTAISPVTPPTPTVTDWKANFKDFATPMVNIQNAPAAPAPGAGLAGLSDLLGKSGVFKDITGLDANQQNVLRTYLSNQENAKSFAEMAKEMAMQQHNTQNSGKIMDQITAAKNSGAITKQEAGQLTKDHLQQQIDGGATKKADLQAQKQASTPSLTKAAVDAANQGRGVKAETTDSEGNSESADISANAINQTSGSSGVFSLLNSVLSANPGLTQNQILPGQNRVDIKSFGGTELTGPYSGLFTRQKNEFPDPLSLTVSGQIQVGAAVPNPPDPSTLQVLVTFPPGENPISGAVEQHGNVSADGSWEVPITLFPTANLPRDRFSGFVSVESASAPTTRLPFIIENATIEWMLDLFDREEQRLGLTDNLSFLARVRKVILPSPTFDKVIGRAKNEPPLYASGSNDSLRLIKSKVVWDGTDYVQIGHAVVGIEGSQNPQPDIPAIALGSQSRLMVNLVNILTWAGDLGGALRTYLFEHNFPSLFTGTPSGATLKDYVNILVTNDQLVGDIDGVVLAGRYDSTQPLATNLRAYYGHESRQRYSNYLATQRNDEGTLILDLEPGRPAPTLTAAARTYISETIAFATVVLLLALRVELKDPQILIAPEDVNNAVQPTSPEVMYLTGLFADFLEAGLASETSQ